MGHLFLKCKMTILKNNPSGSPVQIESLPNYVINAILHHGNHQNLRTKTHAKLCIFLRPLKGTHSTCKKIELNQTPSG